jgi:hypothetical protein
MLFGTIIHRNFLALESRKCAQKSLWGGGRDVLIECLGEDDIGFQGQCAVCWADDILCTKKFCAFIAMQSFMINTLANFEVGPDTITAAACEEAHCEAVRLHYLLHTHLLSYHSFEMWILSPHSNILHVSRTGKSRELCILFRCQPKANEYNKQHQTPWCSTVQHSRCGLAKALSGTSSECIIAK